MKEYFHKIDINLSPVMFLTNEEITAYNGAQEAKRLLLKEIESCEERLGDLEDFFGGIENLFIPENKGYLRSEMIELESTIMDDIRLCYDDKDFQSELLQDFKNIQLWFIANNTTSTQMLIKLSGFRINVKEVDVIVDSVIKEIAQPIIKIDCQ